MVGGSSSTFQKFVFSNFIRDLFQDTSLEKFTNDESNLDESIWTQKGYKGMHAGHFLINYWNDWSMQVGFLSEFIKKGVDFNTPDERGVRPWTLMLQKPREIIKMEYNHQRDKNTNNASDLFIKQWIKDFSQIIDTLPSGALEEKISSTFEMIK